MFHWAALCLKAFNSAAPDEISVEKLFVLKAPQLGDAKVMHVCLGFSGKQSDKKNKLKTVYFSFPH